LNPDLVSKGVISAVTFLVGNIKPAVHHLSEREVLYQLQLRGVTNEDNVLLDEKFENVLTCDANVVNFKNEQDNRNSSETLNATSYSKVVKINSLFPSVSASALDSEYSLAIYSKSLLPKGFVICEHTTLQVLRYEDLLIPCESQIFASLTKDGQQHTISIPCESDGKKIDLIQDGRHGG
jgi:hypothetical protein